MAPYLEDPIREARARAVNSLKPLSLAQYQSLLFTHGGALVGVGTALAAAVSAEMLDKTFAWRAFGTAAIAIAFSGFLFGYVARLTEKAEVLVELLSAQRQYRHIPQALREDRSTGRERCQQPSESIRLYACLRPTVSAFWRRRNRSFGQAIMGTGFRSWSTGRRF
jgi:hypothetical protein